MTVLDYRRGLLPCKGNRPLVILRPVRRTTLLLVLAVLSPADGLFAEALSESSFQFLLAHLLADEGQSGEADESYLAAIDLAPEDPYIRVEYSKFLLRQRRARRAAKEVSTARDLAPGNPDVLRAYAETQMKLVSQDQEALDRTREVLEELRKIDPDDLESMVTLGQIYLSESETDKAVEVFREILSRHSGNRVVYRLLVDALMRSGQIAEAEVVLTAALKFDPQFTRARIGIAEMMGQQGRHAEAVELLESAPPDAYVDAELTKRLAIELHRNGNHERSLSALNSILEKEHDYFAGLYLRIIVLSSLGRSDDAIAAGTKLVELHPESLEVVVLLTGLLERTGRVSDAIRYLSDLESNLRQSDQMAIADRARNQRIAILARAERWDDIVIELESDRAVLEGGELSDLGLLYSEALAHVGRREDAMSYLSQFDSDSPRQRVAIAKQAEILFRLGDIEQAEDRIAELLSTETFEDLVRAAGVYQGLERYDEAIPILERALGERPDSTQVMFWLGASYERTDRAVDAEKMLEALLEIERDFAPALNYLGYMWAEQGEKLGRALSLVEQAVALEPDNGAYIDSLGWAHYQLGNYEEAQGLLERAAVLVGDDPIVFEHLGDLYVALGEFEAAREIYQRALDLNADNAVKVQEKLKQILNDI